MKKIRIILFILSALVISIVAGNSVEFLANELGDHPPKYLSEVSSVAFFITSMVVGTQKKWAGILSLNFGLTNLGFSNESENPGGVKPVAYWIPFAHLDAPLPKMIMNPQNSHEASVLDTDYTPAAGKNFIEIYSSPGKNSLVVTANPEVDCSGEQAVYKIFVPGMTPDQIALYRRMKGTKFALVTEMPDGRRRAMGYDGYPCLLKEVEDNTGEGIMGQKGATLTFQAEGLPAAPFYEGPIPLSGSTLPPQS